MTVASIAPTADSVERTAVLPREAAERLRAQLVALRDAEAARLEELATEQDPTAPDEHVEISTSVATGTLHEIDDALARFESGTYGLCELCETAIPLERLEAIPHTTRCVACASR